MFVAMPTREIHPIVKTAPSATLKNRLHPQHGSAIGHVYVCRPGGGQHNSTVTCTQHPTMKSYTCILHVWGCKVAHVGTKRQIQISTTSQAMNTVQLGCIIHIQPHPCATPTHQSLLWRLDPTCAKSCYLSPLFPAKSHLHSFSPALGHMN